MGQNLLARPAQLLTTLLPTVLAFGTTDPANNVPLKNYDTGVVLPNADSNAVFFVEGASHPDNGPLSLKDCMDQLLMEWEERQEMLSLPEDGFG